MSVEEADWTAVPKGPYATTLFGVPINTWTGVLMLAEELHVGPLYVVPAGRLKV